MGKSVTRGWVWGLIALLGAGACSPSAPPPTALPPAPTPTAVVLGQVITRPVANGPVTPPPVLTLDSTPEVAISAEGSPSDFVFCAPEGDHESGAAIRYDITATLDFAVRTVEVSQEVVYRNETGRALDELVFYVAPNNQPGVFSLTEVTAGSEAAAGATLEGVRLFVPLPEPLPESCQGHLQLAYTVRPPRMGTGYYPRWGYFGFSDRQFNLGQWLPVVAFFADGAWFTPRPVGIGEQGVLTAADFHLALTARNLPEGWTVVGPGDMQQEGETWVFDLPAARDLTVSLGSQYHRLVTDSPNGVQVELYTMDDAQPPQGADYDGPAHALDTAATALELYGDLYGPYPYERLVVLQSDFPDGMELSGLVFVGGEWFRAYTGNPASYLTLITAHEVAHQWWYNLVANDQSATPWLDEALATYSELVFLQENYPELADWWWGFRVDAWSPQGDVDATVYQFDSARAYINAVYLRGARLMHALRQELGGEAFFQWLHDYVEGTRGQVATPADLWGALPPDLLEATFAPRAAYLRDPGYDTAGR